MRGILSKIWRAWCAFGKAVGFCLTTLLLTLMYVIVLPWFRLILGRNVLQSGFDAERSTYWLKRTPDSYDYPDQFRLS